MTERDLSRREIVNLNLCLKAIIDDTKACSGPIEELNDLNKKGRETISLMQKCLQDFKRMAVKETKSDAKQSLLMEINDLNDELAATISVFKKETVQCMLRIEKSSRDELIGGDGEDLAQYRKKKNKEELVNMSSNVTDRLLSISRTLAETTQRSSATLETLVTSSGVVEDTREELDAQGNVISQSGKLLAKYGRREQTDKFLILFAAAFFFACVAYVLQKRLFPVKSSGDI